jgi:NTP pyrophosphatase (non-canonical NTP hydrolase)
MFAQIQRWLNRPHNCGIRTITPPPAPGRKDARAAAINDLVAYFHGKSTANGWWSEADKANPLVVAAKLMLIVSEISEAMEGDRKGLQDDKLPHRKMIEVELGDALIRICDLAGHLGLDLGGATMEKDAFNDVRADHKLAARASSGGKAY